MPKYKCNNAHQIIKTVTGSPLACRGCDGVIIKEGNQLIAPTIRGGFWSFPRTASAGFNCPCTIADPASSELVEVIE